MQALVLNGAVGVGKTTVAESIGVLLGLDGVPSAVIDLDWLRQAWPAPIDDRFNERLGLVNLGSLAHNFADAGIDLLVIAGVVETVSHRDALARAVGGDVWLARLTVDPVEGETRLRHRHHHDDGGVLDWYLSRSAELDATLGEVALDDAVFDTTGQPISAVARQILAAFDAR